MVKASWEKSCLPPIAAISGVIRSFTSAVTTAPNAAPMTTAIARSTTLPRIRNERKPFTVRLLQRAGMLAAGSIVSKCYHPQQPRLPLLSCAYGLADRRGARAARPRARRPAGDPAGTRRAGAAAGAGACRRAAVLEPGRRRLRQPLLRRRRAQ